MRAGATRFNVSIDSLQRDRFFEMTRRDALPRVLRGLEVLASFPEAHPIKVNAVAMRGFTEDEVLPFARFAREHPYEVRFIEFMPLDADHAWTPDSVLSGDEIRAIIEQQSGRWSRCSASRTPPRASTASPTAAARIGFINPVSEPFCGDCNRIRLTADGRLRTCLFSLNETDLRGPLRAGRRRRRARADRARGGLAQGAQAPRQRAGLRPAAADDERHRRLSAAAAHDDHEREPARAVRVHDRPGRRVASAPPADVASERRVKVIPSGGGHVVQSGRRRHGRGPSRLEGLVAGSSPPVVAQRQRQAWPKPLELVGEPRRGQPALVARAGRRAADELQR